MIKRKSVLYDVKHGALNNDTFVDKGISYYQQNDGTHHSDKMVTDECFTYTDTTGTMDVTNACVHCDLVVDNDATICNNTLICGCTDICGATCIDNTLNVTCATCLCDELAVDCDAYFHSNVTVDCNTLICGYLEVDCDTLICGCTEICSDTKIHGPTTINNTLNVNGTTTIAGDLYVKGTSYEEHSTDLYVGADFLTLRDGADTGLNVGEKTGVVINKYDGTDSLGIITDASGVLRIGEFNTVKVYTKDDSTYYLDRDLTEPTTIPLDEEGNPLPLYPIGKADPETNLTEYYYISKDETEALATRNSSDQMSAYGHVWWDEDNKMLRADEGPDTNCLAIPYFNVVCFQNDENPNIYANLSPTASILITNEEGITQVPTNSSAVIVTDHDGIACNLNGSDQSILIVNEDADGNLDPYFLPKGGDRQVLTSCVNENGDIKLQWQTHPTICHYATKALYEADAANVPVGSLVVIDEVENFVVSKQIGEL